MAPLPQDNVADVGKEASGHGPIHHEDVVISGMAAAMPGCNNMMDFIEKLYGKENLAKCEESRWKFSHPELPPHTGKIRDLDRFDAQFFMVNSRLAHFTDVLSRKLLELSYEALFDAGVSAGELNGRRVGVFVAVSYCESEKICSYQEGNQGIAGCNRAMFANRISYWLNSNGPSISLDCNGCGSIVALEQAHQAILSGRCESAIVGACRLLLHPQSLIHYGRQVPLNETGVTKSYDQNADGETLSEGIAVVFLQKQKDARRIYATIAHVKTGYNAQITSKDLEYTPNQEPDSFKLFLEDFYKEAGVSPSEVEYVEGFGSGLPRSDKDELEVIDKIFTKDRKTPLQVGTVMSNIGYTEAASGLSSVIKLLLAYQQGKIAGNINCFEPRSDVAGIREGRLSIVTDHLQFNRSYTAINTFSIIGAYGHVLLKGNHVHKDLTSYTGIPYLLTISGRHESAVEKILNWVKSRPINVEEISLLNTMHKVVYSKHLSRGYGVFKTINNETKLMHQEVDYCDVMKRSLWFVYSGMGSQWVGMGKQLMRIPIFADAIKRCDEVLAPKGMDIVNIITSHDRTMFDNILHSFIGIAAIQIGITDILKAVGIVPDFIIGHSVGELGCAYADGCVTTEEMILLAYYRGLVSIQTPLIKGSMAAIGLGYKQIIKLLPPEIAVACHNGPDSCTISGPADIMEEFVNELSSKEIFAKEVACSNIAYHSKYIATAGPKLLEYCRKVIKSPKLRSDRWLSTSVPQERWDEPSAKYSSAEYHVNNLLNPVLFEETCHNIPNNAVLIEVAPHGLLQAILKRSLPQDCDYIPLTRKSHMDNAEFLLGAIGKIYLKGYDVDISALYPKIDYPVSTKTSSLSHLVEWDHSEKWTVCYYLKPKRLVTACYKPIITIYDEEYQYLDGYRIQGKRILPYSVALLHVWDTLAMIGNKHRDEMSVQFQDVRFYSQPALLDQNSVHLTVELHRGSGRFEVYYDHGIIIRGHIISEVNNIPNYKFDDESESMYNSGEVYKILQEKGYDFKNAFCPIHKINKFLTQAELSWNNNWVTLIEGMIQMKILAEPHDGLSKLEHVHRLSIDVKVHFDDDKQNLKTGFVESRFYKLQNTIQCGGVTIENISFTNVPKQKLQKSVIKTYRFNPFFQSNNNDERTNLYVLMQIVAENTGKETLTVYTCGSTNSSSIDKIIDLLKSPPEIYIKLINIDVNAAKFKKTERPDVIIVDKNQSQKSILERFYTFLPAGTFIITSGFNIEGTYPMSLYKPVVSMGSGVNKLELAIWKPSLPTSTSAVTVKTSSDFNFLRKSHKDLRPQHKLLIFTTYPPIPGLKELVKELRRGPGCQNVCTVLIDQNELNECVDNNTGFELAFNVLTKGTWGGEYYMPNIETELISSRYVRLQILQPGDFNSLSWVKAPQESGSGIAVTVHFAGLNVYDAKKVMSEVATSDDDTFGMDFSGVTERGTRVMGMVSSGAVASVVRVDPQLLWPVPEYWSLEDAATVPLPYCLAFYCLGYIVTLHRGMRVLVHGGAGGLGQAVISIALAHECTVFTTVSDLQKKRFLRKLFPDLPADHIGNSRNDSFSDMVLQKTKGEGCDIIISCVKGDLKNATLKCCAASGTTIDTVQIHTREDFQYGMYNMMKCRNYVAIDFISIFKNQNRDLIKKLNGMVCGGIAAGYVRPLSRVSVAASAARSALGLLAAAKHRGRVLLKMRTLEPAAVVPRLYCSSDKFQLVICNNDDLGIQLADKLVKQGAKKLLLHFIKSSTFLDHKKRIWNHNGVHVETLVQKINDKKSMLNFFKDTSRFGLVEGIYIVAKKDLHSLVADADAAAREIFTFLRYFAVVSRNEFVGYDVHLQRTSSNLPSTLIELHNLEEFDDDGSENSNRLNRQTALEGIEAALCKNRSAFIVYGDRIPEGSIVDEIAKVTGLDSVYEADDDTILEVLGVDEDRAALLHKQIERKFGIYLVKELIPKMKISEFEQLQVKVKDLSVDDLGLDGYFNYIDTDEIRASCDLMPLPTLAQPAKLRPEEFDMTATYLCIVPGIEGSYKRFRQLSERLKLPALVLQLGREPSDVDVDHIANRLTEVLRKKLKLKENFYLFGYEFGVPIALKVAALLESSELTGTVYCLGGTPEDIRNTFISQLKHNNLKELQDTIIHHVSNRLTVDKDKMNYLKDVEDNDDNDDITNKSKTIQEYDKELDEKLKLLDNWEDKVDACLRLIKGKTTHTHQYAKVVLETVYARVRILMDAKTTPSPIKSKIIFLRPYSSKSTEDLSLYSKDFEKHNLDSTLANMTKDLRVTTLINKYLSKDILEKFDKSNHCETVVEEDDLFSLYNNDNMKQVTE